MEEAKEEIDIDDTVDDEDEEDGDLVIEDINQIIEIIIEGNMRKTSNRIQKMEYTELLSVRATHIANGMPIYIEKYSGQTPKDIAEEELRAKKCPLLIKRVVGVEGNKCYVEYWNPNEMSF